MEIKGVQGWMLIFAKRSVGIGVNVDIFGCTGNITGANVLRVLTKLKKCAIMRRVH